MGFISIMLIITVATVRAGEIVNGCGELDVISQDQAFRECRTGL
jgi:hypothetical protein